MPSGFGLLLLYILFATGSTHGFNYEYTNAHFIRPLNGERSKRETTNAPSSEESEKIPEGVGIEEDAESEHIYYNMTIYSNKPDLMKEYYVDVVEWLKKPGIEGHQNHPSLLQSYRKAAGAPIGFSFPFYGHDILNLTIATGGFCYVGDQTHSWLAATQYIAPLMANFDTLDSAASITYATDKKTKMIIAWNNVTLRDNREAGLFNFQVHLHSSGDINFVYKDVPLVIKNISDSNHPCKIGISDAYLFNHKFSNDKMPQSMQMKRVIHEYHRISVPTDKISSNTVIVLKALPTCLQFGDCNSCINSTLKTFNCSWCNPKNPNTTAFCSDQAGLHRRRQDWVENDCSAEMSTNAYCPASNPSTTTSLLSTTELPVTAPEVDVQNKLEQDKLKSDSTKTAGGSGMAIFTVFLLFLLVAGCWFVYAYYNPHTTSGQLLIKYRPSKWQTLSSHVRYSANVHM